MKTITLRDDTYQRLIAIKEDDDSFSDVIDRLAIRKTCDIGKYAGALRDSKILGRSSVIYEGNAWIRPGESYLIIDTLFLIDYFRSEVCLYPARTLPFLFRDRVCDPV